MWPINLQFNVHDDELEEFSIPFRRAVGETAWAEMVGAAMGAAFKSLRLTPPLNGEMIGIQTDQLWPRFRVELKTLCFGLATVSIEQEAPRRTVRIIDHTTGTGAAVAHHDDRERRAGRA
jgi:hypothetical protein